MTMLELLVLKNLIQRTSRRVKRTSGARDTIMQNPEGGRLIKGRAALLCGGGGGFVGGGGGAFIMALRVTLFEA